MSLSSILSHILLIPLAVEGDGIKDPISIIKELTSFATSNGVTSGIANVGVGIGAIMLMIVVFYYMMSILDGGKFQMKMLVPLFIFMLVCNFNWIAKPVTAFTTTITENIVSQLEGERIKIMESQGGNEKSNINDIHNRIQNRNAPDEEVETAAKIAGNPLGDNPEDTSTAGETEKQETDEHRPTFWEKTIGAGINFGTQSLNGQIQQELAGEDYAALGDTKSNKNKITARNLSLAGIISSIISWVCDILSYVLRAFGGVMTGLIVAFGPITFAFAIMPGQGGTIKSWFIRLCQFSLYAPICSLVNCFAIKIFSIFAQTSGAGSVLMAIAVAGCNFVALTSVPTIASMIIEGAQGAVSLSGGLQALAHSLTTAASVIPFAAKAGMGAATIVAGKENMQPLKDIGTGMSQKGIMGAAEQWNNAGSIKGMLGRMQATGHGMNKSK